MDISIRVVGCGRWSMGDDQAGLVAANRLRQRQPANCCVCLSEQPVTDLTDEGLKDVELLVVIDAAQADERHPPGSFLRIDYRRGPRLRLPRSQIDTHSLGVTAGLELAANLNLLPQDVWLYVLFGEEFERAMQMKRAAEDAIPALVDRIEHDLAEWCGAANARTRHSPVTS